VRRDLGDFQTPPALVSAVLDRLDTLGIPRTRVIEPTCGRGNVLAGLFDRANPPREAFGFEIQADHLAEARQAIAAGSSHLSLAQADVFSINLGTLPWRESGPLLVVGNPPWVTSAELGRLASENRPARTAIAGLSGLDARTGRANFDLAEAVWQKLINELDEPGATIALLCKTATARNVLRWSVVARRRVASASLYRIDARRWFSAAVDACLFVVRLGDAPGTIRAPVYPDLGSDTPETTIGVVDGLLVADMTAFEQASSAFGLCPLTWRQGVKHDAAALMELTESDGTLWNGLGEPVDVEPEHVFPLWKGVDLAGRSAGSAGRRVIVTQRSLGDDTGTLAERSPRLHSYLDRHAVAFAARKSKVYARRPPFVMFGVGDYTFAPYKVAIPGLHKAVPFRAIGPVDGFPPLLDDTCYFLPCATAHEAERIARKLNSPKAHALIDSLRFADAKRPITKAILQRIDLDRLDDPLTQRPLASPARVE
jgi:hypothetical protein